MCWHQFAASNDLQGLGSAPDAAAPNSPTGASFSGESLATPSLEYDSPSPALSIQPGTPRSSYRSSTGLPDSLLDVKEEDSRLESGTVPYIANTAALRRQHGKDSSPTIEGLGLDEELERMALAEQSSGFAHGQTPSTQSAAPDGLESVDQRPLGSRFLISGAVPLSSSHLLPSDASRLSPSSSFSSLASISADDRKKRGSFLGISSFGFGSTKKKAPTPPTPLRSASLSRPTGAQSAPSTSTRIVASSPLNTLLEDDVRDDMFARKQPDVFDHARSNSGNSTQTSRVRSQSQSSPSNGSTTVASTSSPSLNFKPASLEAPYGPVRSTSSSLKLSRSVSSSTPTLVSPGRAQRATSAKYKDPLPRYPASRADLAPHQKYVMINTNA